MGAASRSVRRLAFGVLAIAVLLLAIPSSRAFVLRGLGGLLVVSDTLQRSDIAVMTTEDEFANALGVADLFEQNLVRRVGVLVPAAQPALRELQRRGVRVTDATNLLMQLGVPADAIVQIDAGGGGTNEGMAALAVWCSAHQIRRVIVVSSPDHTRRVRRTLVRSFSGERPAILIHSSRFSQFHVENWWQSRTTLSTGIMELEKLVLEYVQHPLG